MEFDEGDELFCKLQGDLRKVCSSRADLFCADSSTTLEWSHPAARNGPSIRRNAQNVPVQMLDNGGKKVQAVL